VDWSLSLSADPKAVGETRRQLRGALCGCGIDEHHVQDALLVTSELVTNAVRHGSRHGDNVELEFRLVDHRLSLCVRDAGRAGAGPQALALTAERSSGRGLAIVSHLARWSERQVDGRREVRAEMEL
jgi:anti-sigma regulatory factor (Ser/Thr protein kinase)